jgi:hypothetical protein
MKKCLVMLGVALFLCAIAVPVFAEDKPSDKPVDKPEVTLNGLVTATKDDAGKIKGATLKVGEIEYNVTMDDNGMKLATTQDGKVVEVSGIVTEKDGKKWVEIKKLPVTEEKPEPPVEKKKGKKGGKKRGG